VNINGELRTKLITPPASEPVTIGDGGATDILAHAKIFIPNAAEKYYVQGLITAARVQCEIATRRAFLTQTWEQYFDHFPRSGMLPDRHHVQYTHPHNHWFLRLIRPPLLAVNSITYVDMNGNLQTMDPSTYVVDAASEPARISPLFGGIWPVTRITGTPANPHSVVVNYNCGFGANSTAALAAEPKFQQAITAIMMLVGHWYANREPVVAGQGVEIPFHISRLLTALTVEEVG
jgi:uncharacterized phiE125 gp8 family phage protein